MRNRSRKAIVDLGIQIVDLKSGFQILNLQSEITMDYLLKTEPSTYSFADLLRDKTTTWDGVSNPVALKNMRAMKAGDRLVIYHTGDEKSAVGTASVVSVDLTDAKNPQED
jgi:predicted RNA-binding protein with PUA-like domain